MHVNVNDFIQQEDEFEWNARVMGWSIQAKLRFDPKWCLATLDVV
jgi:hypothetical protein